MLLAGTGGLPPEQASIIIGNLAQSTPTGIDGYPQRFGIPDGLFAEPVAVKQGWMCCIGADWMHLSTGVIGPDSRYVMAISSMQPGQRRRRPHDDHPGRQDDVPRRAISQSSRLNVARSVVSEPARVAGTLQRLLVPPRRDLGVVTGQQNIWNIQSAPARRPGVARALQQAGRVRIILV